MLSFSSISSTVLALGIYNLIWISLFVSQVLLSKHINYLEELGLTDQNKLIIVLLLMWEGIIRMVFWKIAIVVEEWVGVCVRRSDNPSEMPLTEWTPVDIPFCQGSPVLCCTLRGANTFLRKSWMQNNTKQFK